MTIRTGVTLKPWMVPNFATVDAGPGRREDGFTQLPTIPVAELDALALEQMAKAWLDELYTKAKQQNPFCIVRAR